MKRLSNLFFLGVLGSVAACGGDESTPPDTTPPTVASTLPGDGEVDVVVGTPIAVTFSEAMAPGAGAIVVTPLGWPAITLLAADASWNGAATTITFTLPYVLPHEAEVTAAVQTSFTDVAGNALANPVEFTFATEAAANAPPEVVWSNPVEGATDVPITTSQVNIGFSEAMAQAGTVELSGGPGTVGTPVWAPGATDVMISLSGLAYSTGYKLTLVGFADETSLPLEGGVLGDVALDFTTAADIDRPLVVSSNPMEGQVDVSVDITTIAVTFNEPMDTSTVTAPLVGAGTTTLSGSWDGAGTTITFSVPATLEYETAYGLDLTLFRDLASNSLDPTPVIGDGFVDFTTAAYVDLLPPYVLATAPVEGAASVPALVGTISITFSEVMDTTITDVDLTTGAGTTTLTGTWDGAGTTITFNVGPLVAGPVSVAVAAAGFVDTWANPLDPAVMLVDGVLDFTVIPNTGENCSSPLLATQAVTLPSGALQWTIPAGTVSGEEGSIACDATDDGADAVVEVVKTSGTLAEGGELLYVRVETTSTTTTNFPNVEIVGGACNLTDPGAVQLKCLWFKKSWSSYLDVPAGTYYVWVSKNGTATGFPEMIVTADEVPPSATEGEACFAPYTTASANYQAPLSSADPHRWNLPPTINSFDMDVTWGGEGSISCDNHATYGDIHGVDTVVEFTRSSPTSILQISLLSSGTTTTTDLDIEVFDRCDPTDPGAVSSACDAQALNTTFTSPGTATTMYIWVAAETTDEAFPGAVLDIWELEVGPGESRGTAVALTGSGPIVKASTRRLDPPSCFPTTGNVDWYSYTPALPMSNVVVVTPDTAGAIAIVDASGGEVRCSTNATDGRFGALLLTGGTIYIAVETGSTIGSLTITEDVYDGVKGNVADTGIYFPVLESGDYWLTYNGGGILYLGTSGQEVWEMSTLGGVAVLHDDTTMDGLTTTNMGYGGVWAGGQLFSIDSTTTATSSRVYRLWDGVASPWAPVVWDPLPAYPASSGSYSLSTDGVDLIYVTRNTTQVAFYTLSTTAAGTPTLLGTSTQLNDAYGVAADDEYFYIAGQDAANVEGVFRLSRTGLSGTPLRLASNVNLCSSCSISIVVDDFADPNYLYFRNATPGGIHVVMRPDEAAPIHLGPISDAGADADQAMTIDRGTGHLYQFDTTGTVDTVVRIY